MLVQVRRFRDICSILHLQQVAAMMQLDSDQVLQLANTKTELTQPSLFQGNPRNVERAGKLEFSNQWCMGN